MCKMLLSGQSHRKGLILGLLLQRPPLFICINKNYAVSGGRVRAATSAPQNSQPVSNSLGK